MKINEYLTNNGLLWAGRDVYMLGSEGYVRSKIEEYLKEKSINEIPYENIHKVAEEITKRCFNPDGEENYLKIKDPEKFRLNCDERENLKKLPYLETNEFKILYDQNRSGKWQATFSFETDESIRTFKHINIYRDWFKKVETMLGDRYEIQKMFGFEKKEEEIAKKINELKTGAKKEIEDAEWFSQKIYKMMVILITAIAFDYI